MKRGFELWKTEIFLHVFISLVISLVIFQHWLIVNVPSNSCKLSLKHNTNADNTVPVQNAHLLLKIRNPLFICPASKQNSYFAFQNIQNKILVDSKSRDTTHTSIHCLWPRNRKGQCYNFYIIIFHFLISFVTLYSNLIETEEF